VNRRPAAVAFDVNETLFSLDRLARELPDGVLDIWFARVLRDGFALAATGRFRPFRELAATHLRSFIDGAEAERVLGLFGVLEPHGDVRPALERLRDAGVPAATLTNGHAETTRSMLSASGLADLVADCLSVDDAGLWKPRPEPYHHAARTLGVEPGRLGMVAVHSWDVHGAACAGLVTGYCRRLEGRFVEGFTRPDVTGDTLGEVVEGLLTLPA